ncbi:MAG: hypothetical protein ACI9VR_002023 [Cognaticolwellia sp.]
MHYREVQLLHSVRYAHISEEESGTIETPLACDLDALMEPRPDLKTVPLADGARDMQKLLDRLVAPRLVAGRFVDFWHLIEKLGAAIKEANPPEKDLLATWKADLLQRDDAVRRIYATLTGWAFEHDGEQLPESLRNALTYTSTTTTNGCATPPHEPHACPSPADT